MSGTPSPTSAKIAGLVVLVPVFVLAWFLAPFVLPVWRWQNFDAEALVRSNGLTVDQITKVYSVVLRHAPRGDGDPCPWQIMAMTPAFDGYGKPEFESEENLLVRCSLLSDRTGTGPSALLLGSGAVVDKFFRASVYRLPKGSLGFNRKRPVLMYLDGAFEKLDRSEAYQMEERIKGTGGTKLENDDTDIEDGYHAPGSAPAE